MLEAVVRRDATAGTVVAFRSEEVADHTEVADFLRRSDVALRVDLGGLSGESLRAVVDDRGVVAAMLANRPNPDGGDRGVAQAQRRRTGDAVGRTARGIPGGAARRAGELAWPDTGPRSVPGSTPRRTGPASPGAHGAGRPGGPRPDSWPRPPDVTSRPWPSRCPVSCAVGWSGRRQRLGDVP